MLKMKKHITYGSEDFLVDFYNAIADEDEQGIKRVHIPRSEVIYTKAHLEEVFGRSFTIDYVERCLFLENMLHHSDVLDPDRKRDWE